MLDGLKKRLKFSSNNPSNCVQHDKKVLDINVGRAKSALRNYLKKKAKTPQRDFPNFTSIFWPICTVVYYWKRSNDKFP